MKNVYTVTLLLPEKLATNLSPLPYVYRVDHSRVREVGPDRAAAEWVLRLGGSVKFCSIDRWTKDYNRLPSEPRETLHLEAIDVSCIAVTNNGLEHLGCIIIYTILLVNSPMAILHGVILALQN